MILWSYYRYFGLIEIHDVPIFVNSHFVVLRKKAFRLLVPPTILYIQPAGMFMTAYMVAQKEGLVST